MNAFNQDSPSGTSLRSIQILRALAALSVVFFHIGTYGVFGSFGVDIFFVISGFVMAMIEDAGQAPHQFAINRLTRIVPLYWILTAFLLVIVSIKPDLFNSTTANLENFIKSLLFIPYFKENGALHPMLAVGWTLNYEMFFYLCMGCAMMLLRSHVVVLTTALIATSYVAFGIVLDEPVSRTFFGNLIVFEFVLGLLAYRIHKLALLHHIHPLVLMLLFLGCYSFMAHHESIKSEVDRLFLFGLPSVVLVLSVLGLEQTQIIQTSQLARWTALIGDASYAIYLSHFYVVEGIRKIAFQKLNLINPHSPQGVLIIMILSTLAGLVLYLVLDRPLTRYLKQKFTPKPAP